MNYDRRQISFDESCSRPCALQLTKCGGPTANGLNGYVCENCLTYIVEKFDSGQVSKIEQCQYCGSTPTFAGERGGAICGPCASKGLESARHWYALMDKK